MISANITKPHQNKLNSQREQTKKVLVENIEKMSEEELNKIIWQEPIGITMGYWWKFKDKFSKWQNYKPLLQNKDKGSEYSIKNLTNIVKVLYPNKEGDLNTKTCYKIFKITIEDEGKDDDKKKYYQD